MKPELDKAIARKKTKMMHPSQNSETSSCWAIFSGFPFSPRKTVTLTKKSTSFTTPTNFGPSPKTTPFSWQPKKKNAFTKPNQIALPKRKPHPPKTTCRPTPTPPPSGARARAGGAHLRLELLQLRGLGAEAGHARRGGGRQQALRGLRGVHHAAAAAWRGLRGGGAGGCGYLESVMDPLFKGSWTAGKEGKGVWVVVVE